MCGGGQFGRVAWTNQHRGEQSSEQQQEEEEVINSLKMLRREL
jgi:hypothetical protein